MFQDAIYTAQSVGADYVVYDHHGCRKVASVAAVRVEASCTDFGFDMIAAGISANGKSLYDYDAAQFICGTAAQLMQEIA
jgi:hypothetical protein